jgi:fatty acid desaturase
MDGDARTVGKSGFSAKEDLADRYQEMLDSQLSAIENFDTKAWRVARLVGILLGVLFTGVSVFSSQVSVDLTVEYLPVIIAVGTGVSALIISLIFAALCILSTTAGFGLRVELADALNEGGVDEEDYPGLVTKSYSKNIENNIKVMRAKGRRLRYALSALVAGILTLLAGGVLLFVTLGYRIQIGLLLVVMVLIVGVLYYVLTMQYSVLENGDEEGDNDDGGK